jgi:hypothetical protein
MTKKRKGNNPGPVAVRRPKKREPAADGGAANGEPHEAHRIIEFPKPHSAENVISDRIIFEIGECRFATQWTTEIEQLPPAGPIPSKRQQRLK